MWVRPSTAFYSGFSLDMDRSPGFGSMMSDLHALLTLALTSAPAFKCLNLAGHHNSPDRSTKSTRSQKLRELPLPQLVDTGFQVLFHSPPGVLFTFPSQYCALSVTEEYLALRGGPRSFLQGSTCLVVLRILPGCFLVRLRGSHPLWQAFPCLSAPFVSPLRQSIPRHINMTVWAPPISLAATLGINYCSLFLRLLRCFSSPGSLHAPIKVNLLQCMVRRVSLRGFPHSDTCGSLCMCHSPQLFAAYHVFHRLSVPRHPPCALLRLTLFSSFRLSVAFRMLPASSGLSLRTLPEGFSIFLKNF